MEAIANDPNFATNEARVAHFGQTVKHVSDKVREHSVAWWAECLTKAGVPNSPINSLPAVLAMSHTAARNMVLDYQDPVRGPMHTIAMPVVVDG